MPEGDKQYRLRLSDGNEFGPGNKEQIVQWCREGRVPKDALLVPVDGGDPVSVFTMPELEIVLSAPPIVQGAVVAPKSEADATGGLIPYKNQAALIGYYVSVFSLIPVLALLLGPIAFILGNCWPSQESKRAGSSRNGTRVGGDYSRLSNNSRQYQCYSDDDCWCFKVRKLFVQ